MNQAQREIKQAVEAFTQAPHGQVIGGGVDRYAKQFEDNLKAIVERHGARQEVVKTFPNGIQKIRILDANGELVAEYHQGGAAPLSMKSLSIGSYGGVQRQFSGESLVDAVEAGLQSPALLNDTGIEGTAGLVFVKVTLSPATQDVFRVFGKADHPLQTWTRELIVESQALPTLPQERANVGNPVTTKKLKVEHGPDWAGEAAITWVKHGSKMVAECHGQVPA